MLIQLGKYPLCPAVIARVSSRNFLAPIVAKTQPLELRFKMNFGIIVRLARVFTNLDCVVFYRQSKTIPTDGMVRVIPLLTLCTHLNIRKLVGAAMANMNTRTSDAR